MAVKICLRGNPGHSYALIAEATGTSADILSYSLLWTGLKVAAKPADRVNPYGHGKAGPGAALIVSLFWVLTGLWLAPGSICFIGTPHALPERFTLIVLFGVIIIKELMFRYVRRAGKKINGISAYA